MENAQIRTQESLKWGEMLDEYGRNDTGLLWKDKWFVRAS